MLPIPDFLHTNLCRGYEYVLLIQCSSSQLPLFTRGNIYNLTLKLPHSAAGGRHPINIPSNCCLCCQASSQELATWVAFNCAVVDVCKVIVIKLFVRCWPLWGVAWRNVLHVNLQIISKAVLSWKKSPQSGRIHKALSSAENLAWYSPLHLVWRYLWNT